MKHSRRLAALVGAALAITAASVQAITPDDPGAANVRFTVNSGTGVKAISPYIYGRNFYGNSTGAGNVTLDRLGGNRWTGYNWENNFSNAGADWYHHNDRYLSSSTTPGEAVRPSLVSAANNNRGLIVTVPMAGYVAADDFGTVDETEVAPSPRWKEVVAQKEMIYPGQLLSLMPDKADNYVFTDEFVNWVETTRSPDQTVFYSLDNEPALWGEALPPGWQSGVEGSVDPSSGGRTHPLIHPYAPTYAEMRDKTIAHAKAIKSVNQNALVFGGVGYGYAEFQNLQSASDRNSYPAVNHPGGNQAGELDYLEWLLSEVKKAEDLAGHKLMDVLDVHWYPEATGGGTRIAFDNSTNPSAALIQARVQAPRSLWDPTYTEQSWITQFTGSGPIKLLKHLQRDVDDFNPGTKIAVTEYNYGGTNHISGGVAQADVLGIFGREGVFAATMWPLAGDNQTRFAHGAFKMYLDYDGAAGDGRFGDTSIDAATNVIADSAVYASLESEDPAKVVMVAINRTSSAKSAAIEVTHDQRLDLARVYQLTSASPNPVRVADVPIDLVNAFLYTMPAYSVSTLELVALGEGDFNGDGVVDGGDLEVWKEFAGAESGAFFRTGDNDRDGDVDGEDLLGWQRALGNEYSYAMTALAVAVPEPASLVVAMTAIAFIASGRRSRC